MSTRTRATRQQIAESPPPIAANATQGGGGGGQGGGPGGGGDEPPPPGPGNQPEDQGLPGAVPFALTPALISNEPLNYTVQQDIKLYHKAVALLEVTFNVEAGTLKLFLENFRQRAVASNWMRTLTIERQGQIYNLVDHYGILSYQDVMDRALDYLGQNSRDAQNSMMIFNCLSNSLTDIGKTKVYVEHQRYTVNGVTDGLLLLKVIVQLSHIDTKATITVIRTRLSSLDTKIAEINDDITEFNKYVKEQRISLQARGEDSNDLLINLLKAYKAVSDEKFVAYISTKEDQYNEGHALEIETLMELAEAKYKTMVEREEWKQPTTAEKRIVALTAQIQKLEQEKKKNKTQGNKKETNKGPNKAKPKGNDTKKGNQTTPWFLVPPKEGEKEKTYKNKLYYWCTNHNKEGKWVRHKPEDCDPKGYAEKIKAKKEEAQKKLALQKLNVESEDESGY